MNGFGAAPLTKNTMLWNAVKYGFKTLITHPWLLLKAAVAVSFGFLLPIVLVITLAFLPILGAGNFKITLAKIVLAGLIALFIGIGAWAGILRFVFELHDLARADIKTLFSGFGYVGRLLGVSLLFLFIFVLIMVVPAVLLWSTGATFQVLELVRQGQWQVLLEAKIVNTIALLLACIVEIIVGLRLSYPWYLVVDQNMDAVQALKYSWRITKGFILWLFLLYVIMYLPAQILNALASFLMPQQLAGQPYVESAGIMLFLVALASSIVGVMCGIAAVFARVRFYRLLQARRQV